MMETKLWVFRSCQLAYLTGVSSMGSRFVGQKHRMSSNGRAAEGSNLPTEHFTSLNRSVHNHLENFEQRSLSPPVRVTSIRTIHLPVPMSFG